MGIANRGRMKWIVVYSLFIALAAAGCGTQGSTADPTPIVSPAAGEVDESAVLQEPESPSQFAEPAPTATAEMPAEEPQPTANGKTATPTPTLTPSPTPAREPVLRQLTTGGCCTQPFWSADSQRVLFIDKPAPDAPVGIWGANVTHSGSPPELVTERIGFYTTDFEYVIELRDDTTIIERLADGERWTVPAGGRPVSFSPSRKLIAWEVSNDAPFERRSTQVWVANLDGSDARIVTEIKRGGLSGWISDEVLLLSGHDSFEAPEQALYTLSLADGQTVELARSRRLRGSSLSPDGEWLIYFITFDEDPTNNGLWLVRTDGSARRRLNIELFGAYQWRDARRLLIVPFDANAEQHVFWEYDVQTDESRQLTNPDATSFKIANGDWTVSPDGRHVAFVRSQDRNIWMLTLPD